MKGSYTLVLELSENRRIEVGSLGKIEFSSGFYAYNGSAFGPGGLKRVERHREKSSEGDSPHWHIDYLLIQEEAEIVQVFKSESDQECGLSQDMAQKFSGMEDFGCSDCGCDSHLFYSDKKSKILDFLAEFYPDQGKF